MTHSCSITACADNSRRLLSWLDMSLPLRHLRLLFVSACEFAGCESPFRSRSRFRLASRRLEAKRRCTGPAPLTRGRERERERERGSSEWTTGRSQAMARTEIHIREGYSIETLLRPTQVCALLSLLISTFCTIARVLLTQRITLVSCERSARFALSAGNGCPEALEANLNDF
jgi:hypothetical protein